VNIRVCEYGTGNTAFLLEGLGLFGSRSTTELKDLIKGHTTQTFEYKILQLSTKIYIFKKKNQF